MNSIDKVLQRKVRSRKTRAKTRIGGRPRLLVFRSLRAIYAQIIDDGAGKVVCGVSDLKAKKKGIESAKEVGKDIAKKAKAKKINKVAFDRNGYKYHGRLKALAEAAREAGLDF